MAFNPLRLVKFSSSDFGQSRWYYKSTDDIATVRAANFFRDARSKGMSVGDLVDVVVVNSSGVVTAFQTNMIVLSVTASGADLSDGTAGVVTNT